MPSLKDKIEAERMSLEQERKVDDSVEPELKATEKAEARAKKESKKKITKN